MIEQNYVVKKDYVSKWFSVQEVSKEVLDSEMKVTFNNGNILKYETLCYIITGNGSTITSLETIEFKNKECIIIKKQMIQTTHVKLKIEMKESSYLRHTKNITKKISTLIHGAWVI